MFQIKRLPFFRFKLGVNPTHAILENVNGGYFNLRGGTRKVGKQERNRRKNEGERGGKNT